MPGERDTEREREKHREREKQRERGKERLRDWEQKGQQGKSCPLVVFLFL